jgi:hypothetical protein
MLHDKCIGCIHHDGGCRKVVCALVQWALRGQGVEVAPAGSARTVAPEYKRGG